MSVEQVNEAISEMAARFTAELDVFSRDRIGEAESEPQTLMALIISLNRQLAICTVAFAKSEGINELRLKRVVKAMFDTNMVQASDAAFAQTTVQ